MKIKILLAILAIGHVPSFAQTEAEKDTSWKKGGFFNINANQVSLYNWAAGGDNAVSITGILNAYANYNKNGITWDNSLDLGYGVISSGKSIGDGKTTTFRKNEDRLEINSKFGQKATGKFFYSGMANFRTQFAPGFSDLEQKQFNSDFMSPGYLTIALGMDWKPVSFFSLFVSPATGKYTYVGSNVLADAGAFGVQAATFDPVTGEKLSDGKHFRPEFGASIVTKFQKDIMKNVNLKAQLTLFNNFTDKIKANRANIDVNGEAAINMKVNRFITVSIIAMVIYDHDINIKEFDDSGVQIGEGPRTQYKQVLGVGLSYKF